MLRRFVRALGRLLVRYRHVIGVGAAAVALIACLQLWNRLSLPSHVSTLPFHEAWSEFGGWSGLDVSADGATVWIVSDGSLLVRGQLGRDTAGKLQRFDVSNHGFLIKPRLWLPAIPEDRGYRDAESLSLTADGIPFVTFERIHRLIAIEPGGVQRPKAPLRADAGVNSGIEAFALAPDGTAYGIPERAVSPGWPYTLWVQRGDGWQPLGDIPRQGRWRASGADLGPDGMLYLLERGLTAGGFTTRVRRLDPARPEVTETVYLSPPGRHGNLEGLGVWRDAEGHLRLLMVADDNFYWFQRSDLVEVTLPLAPHAAAQ